MQRKYQVLYEGAVLFRELKESTRAEALKRAAWYAGCDPKDLTAIQIRKPPSRKRHPVPFAKRETGLQRRKRRQAIRFFKTWGLPGHLANAEP